MRRARRIALYALVFVLYLASTVPVGLLLYSVKNGLGLQLFSEGGLHDLCEQGRLRSKEEPSFVARRFPLSLALVAPRAHASQQNQIIVRLFEPSWSGILRTSQPSG